MKHITYLVLLCICTMSCKAQTNNYAVISGTTHVKGIDSIYLTSRATNFKKAIAVNNGSFNDTITIDKVRYYRLSAGRAHHTLYLQNGYNLNISIDKGFTSRALSFSGVGADVNSYYKAKKIFMRESDKESNRLINLSTPSEQDFTTLTNKISDSITAMLNNAQIEDENFMIFEKENIFWDKIHRKLLYFARKKNIAMYHATRTYTPSPGFLPQALLNFKSDNEDLFINSSSYFNISTGIPTGAVLYKVVKKENIDEIIKHMDSIYNTLNLSYVKDATLLFISRTLIIDKDEKIAKTYLDYFTSRLYDENIKTDMVNRYNKNRDLINARQRIKKGDLSPKFVDFKNFAGGTTSLDDLKGKYVYINVWATWCHYCREEIPFLNDIEKRYHNKNIEFVSISVDEKSTYNTWINMVTDKQLIGIQLLADNALESQFLKDYGINATPKFMLIDPEGKVINSNAPRPSYPELTVLLDGLLGK